MPIFAAAHPLIKAGKRRALAIAVPRRNPVVPQVLTLTEPGVPGIELSSWAGISTPAGTPDVVVKAIYKGFFEALRQPVVVASLQENGGMVDVRDAAPFIRSIRLEMQLSESTMKKVGLQPI